MYFDKLILYHIRIENLQLKQIYDVMSTVTSCLWNQSFMQKRCHIHFGDFKFIHISWCFPMRFFYTINRNLEI